MANIRASAVATTVLAAAVSAVTPSVSASIGSISATPYVAPQVRMSVFVVPLTPLTAEVVIPSDFRALDVTKVLVDVVTVTDTNNVSFAFNTVAVDSVAIVENSVKIFNRTDAAAATDADAKTVGQVSTDAVSTSEAINTKDVGKTLIDSAAATEANAKSVTKPDLTDSVSGSDAIVASTDKVLTDTASASDAAVLTPGKVLSDSISAPTDAINTFAVGKYVTDSFTPADAINTLAVTKVLTDTATTSDVLVTNFIPANTVPFVDFAFASDEKFTYSSTLGMLNAHLIHEPLVNGEFVLTTNLNAGIVYTIRTESEFTFAGYQVNGNQLN